MKKYQSQSAAAQTLRKTWKGCKFEPDTSLALLPMEPDKSFSLGMPLPQAKFDNGKENERQTAKKTQKSNKCQRNETKVVDFMPFCSQLAVPNNGQLMKSPREMAGPKVTVENIIKKRITLSQVSNPTMASSVLPISAKPTKAVAKLASLMQKADPSTFSANVALPIEGVKITVCKANLKPDSPTSVDTEGQVAESMMMELNSEETGPVLTLFVPAPPPDVIYEEDEEAMEESKVTEEDAVVKEKTALSNDTVVPTILNRCHSLPALNVSETVTVPTWHRPKTTKISVINNKRQIHHHQKKPSTLRRILRDWVADSDGATKMDKINQRRNSKSSVAHLKRKSRIAVSFCRDEADGIAERFAKSLQLYFNTDLNDLDEVSGFKIKI